MRQFRASNGQMALRSFLALIVSQSLLLGLVHAQDMGDMGDDGGGGGGEDMSDVLDPSMLGIDGSEGDLNELLLQGRAGGGMQTLATLKVQSLLALQELGVVIGVAFMMGTIFLLMVFLEKMIVSVGTRFHKRFGKPEMDPEDDPAALVGTFKRYKN